MKKKVISVAVLLLALFALVLLDRIPGLAAKAAAPETGDIGFYVRAVLPKNQIDNGLTYFDLRMRPGQTQTLEVEVVNETGAPITVDIAAVSASTNRNGVIDYKTPGIRDASLLHPFSQLAALENGSLEVPANGSATARVTLAMPEDAYDGVVLGSLVFTRRPGERPAPAREGMQLQNTYSYVVGVKLSETDAVVLPDFEVEGVRGETVDYQPAMVHIIRNRAAAIAKGVNLKVTVRDENGNVVGVAERTGVDMAPNSVMPLAVAPLAPGAEDGAAGELLPGSYTSEITLEHGGQSWQFEQPFTVGQVEAEQVNAETVGVAARDGLPLNTLLIVALAIAAVLIVILFVILMRLLRRREETKELNRLMRQRHRQLRQQQVYKAPKP